MKFRHFCFIAVALSGSLTTASAVVNIVIKFDDIGEGGVGGSGLSNSQAQAFTDAEQFWETYLVGYAAGVTGPAAITIKASAPAIDGPGGTLGAAGPDAFVNSGGFVLTEAGQMFFDKADSDELEASGEWAGVIQHEMGHVLGIGTLWVDNVGYVLGSGQYFGANALAKYQRDFDPNATFVPVEIDSGNPSGTDDGHWDEASGIQVNNPSVPYNGELLDDELMTGFATGSLYLSDLTIGSFADMGYQVKYILEDAIIFHWDAGNPTGDGAITSGDGIWDSTINNWTTDEGASNVVFEDRGAAVFGDTGSTVNISGTVKPFSMTFDVTGYTLTGGTIDLTEEGTRLAVTNSEDSVTFNTSVIGAGTLTIEGPGGVINQGSIASPISLAAGSLTNNGGTITGDLAISSGASYIHSTAGFGSGITLNNSGMVSLDADDTIASYVSSGGTLDGSSTLTADTYDLSSGAIINANLGAGTLNINSGSVTLNGTSGAANVNILGGATLMNGADRLNSSATLSNSGTFTLGGNETIGAYAASPGAILNGNGILTTSSFAGGTVSTTATGLNSLSLLVNANGGNVTLGEGTRLAFGVDPSVTLETFNLYPLFSNAAAINGDATSIGFETFDVSGLPAGVRGVFDVVTGNVYLISSSGDGTPNTSAVSAGIIGAGFDGNAIFANINGLAANAQAILDRANALANASATDEVTLQTQLQELSPEVYGGLADYGIKSHMAVLNEATATTNVLRYGKSRVFAGLSTYDADTSNSRDDSDYNVQTSSAYLGVSRQLSPSTRMGIIGAADDGEITAKRLDLDATGTLLSLFTETELNMPFDRGLQYGVFRTSIGFSEYSMDGTRTAQGLTNTVDDIDSGVFEASMSYRAEIFNSAKHKVTPFVGVRYIKSETDAFTETGTINSLSIQEFSKEMYLLEYGLDSRWMPVSDKWGFTAMIKLQHNFGDDEVELDASFPGAASPFTVTSPGFSEFSVEANGGLFFEVGKGKILRLSAYVIDGDDYSSASGVNAHFSYEW